MDRVELASEIARRLAANRGALKHEFERPGQIPSFVVDDLLPESWATAIRAAFPPPEKLMLRDSFKERKWVGAQMDRFSPLLEEAVFAFQAPAVLRELEAITGIPGLLPDPHLYAGGISAMGRGHFLNPHIDNSHDKDRQNYRVLNSLFYVTPGWQGDSGGHLELWDNGVRRDGARVIESRFNRLVLMLTDRRSWHSVNPVQCDALRTCVSNYFFSPQPPRGQPEYFHVTTFRGRPEQPLRDMASRADASLRMLVRTVAPHGIRKPWHVYRR